MDDTNVKLTVDLGYKALQHFNKLSHQIALTVDIGPNVMLAIKYLAGSLIIYKSIDSITNLILCDKRGYQSKKY